MIGRDWKQSSSRQAHFCSRDILEIKSGPAPTGYLQIALDPAGKERLALNQWQRKIVEQTRRATQFADLPKDIYESRN